MINFRKLFNPPSNDELLEIESNLGFSFPDEIRNLYLRSNGGVPSRRSLIVGDFLIYIAEVLPVSVDSDCDEDTAISVYQKFLKNGLLPLNLFPIAIDGGGSYLLLDIETESVFLFNFPHDNTIDDLGVKFVELWSNPCEPE